MTREEAIERLKTELKDYTPHIEKFEGAKLDCEALEMAIKALEQQSMHKIFAEISTMSHRQSDDGQDLVMVADVLELLKNIGD